jgi:hypothetical protein
MPSVLVPTDSRPIADASLEEPSIFVDPSALSLLPGDMTVLVRFIEFVRSDVLQEHIPTRRIEVRGSVDPEDDTSQIVVRVWIRGLADTEIRRYYQELGGRVDSWTAHLPEAQRQQFVSRLSFQARREADA